MIIVAGTVQIKPEMRDVAIQIAKKMAQATQAETGCIGYKFYADLEDETTFFIFEAWETEEVLAQHFQTEHMAEFQQHLPNLLAGEIDVKRYDVTAITAP